MKKAILMVLLSFAAVADNQIELTGDLNITGTDKQAETTITYDVEGNTVNLRIGLSLKDDSDGGGTGGEESQTIDETVPNNQAHFEFPEPNVIDRVTSGGTDGAYGLASVDNNGYYYFEVEILSGSNFNTVFGFSWSTSENFQNSSYHGVRLSDGMQRAGSFNAGLVPGWQTMSVGDSLRIWVKDRKIYVGQIIGGVASVIGDPAAGTGHVGTIAPNNNLRGVMVFLAANSYKYKGLSSNIAADALGATPIEEQ